MSGFDPKKLRELVAAAELCQPAPWDAETLPDSEDTHDGGYAELTDANDRHICGGPIVVMDMFAYLLAQVGEIASLAEENERLRERLAEWAMAMRE